MGKINILDTESANMIAAGEVVDRPSSALKEIIENAIDAHSTNITVELKNGGNSYIRVTDDGDGIYRDDMPKTLYRHATSKIKSGLEIDGVKTLGFRGEALAAISSVSRMEIISKTRDSEMGSKLTSDESGVELYDIGCADGTTVIINDLFYNVPARRKFMKKDTVECASSLAVCERASLSHPEIAFNIISDGEKRMRTSGDNELFSAIYSIYGSKTANIFESINYSLDGVTVSGYISRPDSPRPSRVMQTFFINGRFIKSRTVQAALEEAYRSYIPSGKFPAAILHITVDPESIDVNVHPAKTEIKFADERKVFSCVYYGVKGVLEAGDEKTREKTVYKPSYEFRTEEKPSVIHSEAQTPKSEKTFSLPKTEIDFGVIDSIFTPKAKTDLNNEIKPKETVFPAEPIPEQQFITEKPEFRIIGEAYNTFVFAEFSDKVIIVDKHAAHERILYEKLRTKKILSVQSLLVPVTVILSPSDAEALIKNSEILKEYGFGIEEYGPSVIAVREVPSELRDIEGISEMLEQFAHDISENTTVPFADKVDKALYTIACKAAVKAHEITTEQDNAYIIENIIKMNLKYCPHGRPFIKEIPKREIERFFDR